MKQPRKSPVRLEAGRGAHSIAQHKQLSRSTRSEPLSAATIAAELKAKRIGDHWMACCVTHDDKHPSMSIAEGRYGPLVHCFAGCSQTDLIEALRARGLWSGASPQMRQQTLGRRKRDEIWIQTVRDLIAGRKPDRLPPYTRTLPRTGEVQVITGVTAWGAAKMLHESGRHALVAPSDVPTVAYRWPVFGRRVLLFDMDQWPISAERSESFARLLVARWGAIQVRAFGDYEPLTITSTSGVGHAH